MERQKYGLRSSDTLRAAAGLLLAASTSPSHVTSETTGVTVEHQSHNVSTVHVRDDSWQLAWKDEFNSPDLSSRWAISDNTTKPWERFEQYRQFGVRLNDGKLVLTARRHCVTPGEDMTLGNAQTASCPDGSQTKYSTGRIEELKPSITGNFRIEVIAKMPTERGARSAIWANNLVDDTTSHNAGYCSGEGTYTPTAEIDLIESAGYDEARATHHVRCKDGKLAQVVHWKRQQSGWLRSMHSYVVEKIGNRMAFYVDGEALPILGRKNGGYSDIPADFEGVTQAEYEEAYSAKYPLGMIFDQRVSQPGEGSGKLFEVPDDDAPFEARRMKIDSIKVFTRP